MGCDRTIEDIRNELSKLEQKKNTLEAELKALTTPKDGNIYRHKQDGNYRVLLNVNSQWIMVNVDNGPNGYFQRLGSWFSITDIKQTNNFNDWEYIGTNLKEIPVEEVE